MGQIQISETQLLFGYFHSYLTVNRGSHFDFPSLRQEGGRVAYPFPGADLIIDNHWLIQFKRPFYLKTNGIKEFTKYRQPRNFEPPYYRFHIKNDSPTNQFKKLIDATRNGFRATYISPLFRDDVTFQRLLQNHTQHLNSYTHIELDQFDGMQNLIGRNNRHTILYNPESVENDYCYCFSEPKKVATSKSKSKETNRVAISVEEAYSYIMSNFFKETEAFSNQKERFTIGAIQNRLLLEYDICWLIQYRKK